MDGKWMMTMNDDDWSYNDFGLYESEDELLNYIESETGKNLWEIWSDWSGEELEDDDKMFRIYYGQINKYVVGVDAEFVLENISENAFSECGECAEDYLYDVKKEHIEELESEFNEVLDKWMNKYNYKPHFYNLNKVKTYYKKV